MNIKTDYYDNLLKYLNHSIETMSEDKILSKGKELGIILPNSLIRFYHYFGNCDEVMNGFYKFFSIEEIGILNEGLVFGINSENGILGIRLKDLNSENDPKVYYTYEKYNDEEHWFSELNYSGSEAFFFNIAAMNIIYNKPYVAVYNIPKKEYNDHIENKKCFCSFLNDETVSKGYQFKGFHDISEKILGCYWKLTKRISISADSKDELDDFIHSTGIAFTEFSYKPIKKTKKKKNLPKLERSIVEDCYKQLEVFLPKPTEKILESVFIEKAKEFGINFPQPVIDFYSNLAGFEDTLGSFYQFYTLDNIHIENNTLLLGATDESQTYFGIQLDCIDYDEPYITEFSDDKCTQILEMYSASSFLFNAACFQIMNTMNSMAVIYLSKQYFFSKILDKKALYSFSNNKLIKKGYNMTACHNEEYTVLCCYIDGKLYVAAHNDEILNDFEINTKWKLDWL